jgi:hypothetical protein
MTQLHAPTWHGRWTVAALVACLAYVLAYSQDVTLFYYYPMVGEWHWSAQAQDLGPRITYYGWKSIGVLAGACSLVLPARWTHGLSPHVLWTGAMAIVAIVCMHEMHWFLK